MVLVFSGFSRIYNILNNEVLFVSFLTNENDLVMEVNFNVKHGMVL